MDNNKNSNRARRLFNDICNRELERKLELYILNRIIKKEQSEIVFNADVIKSIAMMTYAETKKLAEEYTYMFQLDGDGEYFINGEKFGISDIDEEYKRQMAEYNKTKSESKRHYRKIRESDGLLDTINNLLKSNFDDGSLQCHYCGITDSIISQIIIKTGIIRNTRSRFFTKAFYSRGKNMEVDRMEPNDGYTTNNLVLACYWCNNAKSDEFSYDEFKSKIAPKIREIWEDRFKDNSNVNIPKEPDMIIKKNNL